MSAYRQVYHSFFKEHVQSITKGQYWLDEYSSVLLGEPVIFHPNLTGLISTPKKKRIIQSYPAAADAGELHAFGVSLDIRGNMSGLDTEIGKEILMLRPDIYYPREIAVMQLGICKIINQAGSGTVAAQVDEIALPIDNGAVPLSYAGHYTGSGFTLGKWLEETPGQEAGLVFVDPKAEVLI